MSYIRKAEGATSRAEYPKDQRAINRAFRIEVNNAEAAFLKQLEKELRELRLG